VLQQWRKSWEEDSKVGSNELRQESGKRKTREMIAPLQWFSLSPCPATINASHCIPNFFCNADLLLACYPPHPPTTPQILPIYSYTLFLILPYSTSCLTPLSKERSDPRCSRLQSAVSCFSSLHPS